MTKQSILRDDSGATIIEFALLGPIVLGLMIAVIQIGLAMQSYNAVRSVTAETARFALVAYQQGNDPTNATIRTQALRSEEYTSELQSLMRISYAVFCLKKKKK